MPKRQTRRLTGYAEERASVQKMTLIEALQNIQYDSSWGIWAKASEADETGDNGGLFEGSPARYGQMQFENGGLLDDYVFVCHGEWPADRLTEWCDGSDECEWDWQFTDQILQELNESQT